MTICIRKAISEKVKHIIKNNNVFYELEVPLKNKKPALHWPLPREQHKDALHAVAECSYDKELISEVKILPAEGKQPAKVEFKLDENLYIKNLLKSDENNSFPKRQERMIFEYSSPNIAKPFHVGHLRSTIIGNALANLHQTLGYPVTKMNYLGDWGTQFGLLQVGVEMLQITDEEMQKSPIETLYKAYVRANQEAIKDEKINDKARMYFNNLETGQQTSEMMRQWQNYRDYTIQELKQVYQRIGVSFDIYDWESQYSQKHITQVLDELNAKNLTFPEKDGRKVVVIDGRRVPIIKSDGSTLYLVRDIAALLDRWNRFQFEKIFYVVDNGQTDHFKACFQTTSRLMDNKLDAKLEHVKFGRIHGMSTRRGQTVFLKDLLDEARDIMHAKQQQSQTTKTDVSSTEVADILGVSAVLVNDLKQRRQRDYDFSWDKALQVNGDTGIKLQYTHCRLYSLLQQNANIRLEHFQPALKYLDESEAWHLINELSRYPQVLWHAKEQLEACVLVNYLFSLCNSCSRALKCLPVKNEKNLEKQQSRLLLFSAVKSTLNQGMQILGLKPLNKM